MSTKLSANDTLRLNADVTFGSIHVNNVGQLRRLQEAILPVRYTDQFYEDVIKLSAEGTAKLAYFQDLTVGAACCRLEKRLEKKMLYVMTLVVLPAYRGRKIGTELLKYMIAKAKELNCEGVFLHVWTSNQEGIDFYKNFNFEVTETIQNYYKRIDPPDCHILELRF